MEYVSQYGQDKWVYELLGENRYFLDVGSYCPVEYSNTYVLENKYNWTGLCIEAQKYECDKYPKYRKCAIVNALVDSEIYDAKFVVWKGLSGIITNYSESDRARLLRQPEFKNKTLEDLSITIKTRLISDILVEYKVPEIIDYWSLDVEGSELKILKSFPWQNHHVNAVTIEHNRLPSYYEEIRHFMKNLNFEVHPNLLSDNEDCFVNHVIQNKLDK